MKSPISHIIVFDIETTGLSSEKNAMIEVACCVIDNELNDVVEYESGVMSIYDNREIQSQALQANGITMNQIENGRDPKEVLNELINLFKKYSSGRNKPVLSGHNIDKFDIPFVANFFNFFGKNFEDYVNTDLTIDTMWWARLRRNEQVNYKLGTCCEIEGVELVNAHRAISDTRSNKELVKKYIRSLRSEGDSNKEEKRFRKTFEF